MTPQEILDKAIGLIDEGWIQGDFYGVRDGKLCQCADGALLRAAGIEDVELSDDPDLNGWRYIDDPAVPEEEWEAYAEQRRQLREPYVAAFKAASNAAHAAGFEYASIIGFNDAVGRTADEVKAVLTAAKELV